MATICEVVVSYNRPRMLAACLASVAAARPDQLIVVDDGSLFDVPDLCARFPVTDLVTAPPMSVDKRMTAPRQGGLINAALRRVRCDVASLICDDDLRADGWYDTLRAHWAARPAARLVRGRWLRFDDGAVPALDDMLCPMCEARKMTAGNFAWRADLTRHGAAAWPEDQLNCLDDGFLRSLHRLGIDVFRVREVGFAGWRREHPKVNNNYSTGRDHTPEFRAVLEAGWLE